MKINHTKILSTLLLLSLFVLFRIQTANAQTSAGTDTLQAVKVLTGLDLPDVNVTWLKEGLRDYLRWYEQLRSIPIQNQLSPALWFDPIPPGKSLKDFSKHEITAKPQRSKVSRPANLSEICFWPITDLAELIRTRQITSEELTQFYLARLKKYNPKLNCVITFTDSLALAGAREADKEIAAGHYRGVLHGIPFGVKDLLAVKGYPTSWGALPYKDMKYDYTATVVRQLQEAGAILLAKLSMGELAIDDIWFGGMTRNPWDLEQGSSGSSAGSASAVSAGLLPFAIGSETWGSIVSPSTRCGVTGLRPTYGHVSRYGAMALSWSMDKLGPICRNADDCGIVLGIITRKDPSDPAQYDMPVTYPCQPQKALRIGYLKTAFSRDSINQKCNEAALDALKKMGYTLTPVELPSAVPVMALSIILDAEAAAAFDELVRNREINLLMRQEKGYWPDIFQRARAIPAVEYIQANRLRTQLISDMDSLFSGIDILLSPSMDDTQSLITNLTGHPCISLPTGLYDGKHPASITFIGKLFDESTLINLAKDFQEATSFDELHPPAFTEGNY